MAEYYVAIPSWATNSILTVVLEILIVLLGQNVYHAWINDRCRRQLISKGSTQVYGIAEKYSLFISVALIFIISESIELGFSGESGEEVFRNLHPMLNLSQSQVSDWVGNEQWDKQPADVQLSDFRVLEKRERCIRHNGWLEREILEYYAYGQEGCFDTIRTYDSFFYESHLKIADVHMYTFGIEIEFLDKVDDGVEDFWSVQFGDIEQTAVTFDVEWRFIGEESKNNGSVVFSVLQNQEYGSAVDDMKRNETVSMVLWYSEPDHAENHFTCFQLVLFSDVFVTPWMSNTTLLIPKRRVQNFSCFKIATYSAIDSYSKGSLIRIDNARLTSRKAFYALSKLHFALEPNSTTNTAFSTHLISEIDNHLFDSNRQQVLRYHMPRDGIFYRHPVVSLMAPYAVFELAIVILLLVLAKLVLLVFKYRAPVTVNVFDARYMAAVKLRDHSALRKYCREGYHVFMVRDEDGKFELKLEIEADRT